MEMTYVLGIISGIGILLIGVVIGAAFEAESRPETLKADEGLFYCKLGENYVWLNKDDVLKFFFTDRSE